MKIPSSIWTLLIGILLTLVSLWYGQNHGLMPVAASREAQLVDGLFDAMMIVSTGIFLIVQGVLVYSGFRYRKRAGDETDGPPVEGNIPLEILWTAIPAIIVIGISVYSFEVYNEMGGFDPHGGHNAPMISQVKPSEVIPSTNIPGSAMAATLATLKGEADDSTSSHDHMQMVAQNSDTPGTPEAPGSEAPSMQVSVMGMQYAFIFTYPEIGITSGELHVPIGKTVELNMTGTDVIHAFWVPEFRLKQDIIPGRETTYRFTPRKAGDYAVICAELCGPYHGAMRTSVVVESQAEFDNWQQEQLVAMQQEMNQAIALNSTDLSADKFLAPYVKEMGIKPEIFKQIQKQIQKQIH
ncbi:MAG: cytochrome c oxidase subunit II [Calothrix sp. SM1_7_51]|nr:cytochrome c oxidase subunit II [Calothrix sp. SM1_7_51]